jgi:hypothetical protein
MKSAMTKHKHLTLSDRNDIQLGLELGETFTFGEDIAALLGCQFVKPEDTHLSPDLLK